jgi:hypothetical protein
MFLRTVNDYGSFLAIRGWRWRRLEFGHVQA